MLSSIGSPAPALAPRRVAFPRFHIRSPSHTVSASGTPATSSHRTTIAPAAPTPPAYLHSAPESASQTRMSVVLRGALRCNTCGAGMLDFGGKVARLTGLAPAAVGRVLQARFAFLVAVGVAGTMFDDDGFDIELAMRMRDKYPYLLPRWIFEEGAKSRRKPSIYELEARVIHAESGEPLCTVLAVVAAEDELHFGLDVSAYRAWAREWLDAEPTGVGRT